MKTREIKQQKIKTTKIPVKQINLKQNISNYIRKIQRTKKIEHKLKEEEQTEIPKQLKGDDTEKNKETSSQTKRNNIKEK